MTRTLRLLVRSAWSPQQLVAAVAAWPAQMPLVVVWSGPALRGLPTGFVVLARPEPVAVIEFPRSGVAGPPAGRPTRGHRRENPTTSPSPRPGPSPGPSTKPTRDSGGGVDIEPALLGRVRAVLDGLVAPVPGSASGNPADPAQPTPAGPADWPMDPRVFPRHVLGLSYELRGIFEPKAGVGQQAVGDTGIQAGGFPALFVLRLAGGWWACPSAEGSAQAGARNGAGGGAGIRWRAFGDAPPPMMEDGLSILPPRAASAAGPRIGRKFQIEPIDSASSAKGYQAAVARAVSYIHAGDVYQVNLAHRLSTPMRGSSRGLFAHLVERQDPACGIYIELPDLPEPGGDPGDHPGHKLGDKLIDKLGHERVPAAALRRAIVSLSPELFLHADMSTGQVLTRPMKGTRPASPAAEPLRPAGDAAAAELLGSVKDRAELAMIVDLMRNDLGRVARFGSVRVQTPRVLEYHGSGSSAVWQAVADVSATLRPGTTLGGLLSATFPPGSVTGAPKVRAMQIIAELETFQRGPYCGCLGWLGQGGILRLAVAIRTALVSGRAEGGARDSVGEGRLEYAVGAGIVSDSDAGAEWEETLAKARAVLDLPVLAGAGRHALGSALDSAVGTKAREPSAGSPSLSIFTGPLQSSG